MYYLRVVFTLSLFFFGAVTLYGQDIDVNEAQIIRSKHDRIIQDETKRQYDQKKRFLQKQMEKGLSTVPIDGPKRIQSIKKLMPGFIVSDISISGITVMDKFAVQSIKKQYEARVLTLNDINLLLADLTNWYVQNGYVTTRVYLSEQNLMDGILSVIVVEGRVSDIHYLGDTPKRVIPVAFPKMKGAIFQLRDLEQGLDVMNRLESNNVTVSINPGPRSGESIIVLKNNNQNPNNVTLRYDNYSQNTLNLYPKSIDLSRDDFFGINDSIRVGVSQSNSDGGQNSHSLSVSFSIPYGYWLLDVSAAQFEYTNFYTGNYGQYVYSGESRTLSSAVSRVLGRSTHYKTTAFLGAGIKDLKGFGNSVPNPESTYRLVELKYGMSQMLKGRLGVLNSSVSWVHGLSRFGAKVDANNAALDVPKAQFYKLICDFSAAIPIQFRKNILSFRTSVHAQYTEETLFSSQKISIGDFYSVRGFNGTTISGDKGVYSRNELSRSLGASFPGTSFFQQIMIFSAFDFGYVSSKIGIDANNGQGKGKLAGAALGLRAYFDTITFEGVLAQPISYPSFIDTDKWVVGFNTSIRLI